jgi:hypothetical protein
MNFSGTADTSLWWELYCANSFHDGGMESFNRSRALPASWALSPIASGGRKDSSNAYVVKDSWGRSQHFSVMFARATYRQH